MAPQHGAPPAKPVAKSPPNQTSKKLQPEMQSSSSMSKLQDQQQLLKCPRCDSSNTKFCYYNNYSLAQPRHFCKTCRRYWTKGGALRNVPIGGGSRKSKKLKSSSSSKDFAADIGGLKLFHGMSPAIDFQLGGFEIPRVNPQNPLTGIYETQFPAFGEGNPNSIIGGLNFPLQVVIPPPQPPVPSSSVGGVGFGDPSSMKIDHNLASSIESLSCINQDLHWKLQQQRLAALFADGQAPSSNQEAFSSGTVGSQKETSNVVNANGSNVNVPPATEWFFGNSTSYASVTPSPTDSGSNGNENTSCNNNWNTNSNISNGGGVVYRHHQGWGARNVQQYTSLP